MPNRCWGIMREITKIVPYWGQLSPRRLVATSSVALLSAVSSVVIANAVAQASDPCLPNVPQALYAPTVVYPGAVILCSNEDTNQAYSFQFQGDCNLVLLIGRWKPLWSSNTGGRNCNSANSCLAIQGDGNFVLYWPNGCGNQPVLWQSGTGNQPQAQYCVTTQVDGNVVVYAPPCNAGGAALIGTNLPTWTQSSHTRSFSGADSWRTQPLMTGRTSCRYPCHSTTVYFRAWDYYSSRQPGWSPAVTNSVAAWNVGPISYSFSAGPNDTWNFIYASFPGDSNPSDCGLALQRQPTAYAVTIRYDETLTAANGSDAMSVFQTSVCLNQNQIDPSWSQSRIQNTVAHELGHTTGLAHNFRDPNSIMNYTLGPTGPDNNDIGGPAPGCPNRDATYGGYGGGVMCIYGWGD